jgi:hypothetical protein
MDQIHKIFRRQSNTNDSVKIKFKDNSKFIEELLNIQYKIDFISIFNIPRSEFLVYVYSNKSDDPKMYKIFRGTVRIILNHCIANHIQILNGYNKLYLHNHEYKYNSCIHCHKGHYNGFARPLR